MQQKICTEISSIIGNDPKAAILPGDLHDMKYTECVIKESLRFRPPVSFIVRALTKPAIIDGITLPIGTNILFNIHGLHHSDKYYRDPLTFNPDRFSAENQKNLIPNTWVPFSLGIRNCIGII